MNNRNVIVFLFHKTHEAFLTPHHGWSTIITNRHAIRPLKLMFFKEEIHFLEYSPVVFLASGRQNRNCSTKLFVSKYRTNTMSCASLPISLVSSSCKLNLSQRLMVAIVCCSITTHYPGHFNRFWFNQIYSSCVRCFCTSDFPCNRKRSTHCMTMSILFLPKQLGDQCDFASSDALFL